MHFRNYAALPIKYSYGSEGWCWPREDYVQDLETFSCPGTYFATLAGGNTPTPDNRDADSIKFDAGCITSVRLNYPEGGITNHTEDRRLWGSRWIHYSLWPAGPSSVDIMSKTCYPPLNFRVYSTETTSITVAWDVIQGNGSSYILKRYRAGTLEQTQSLAGTTGRVTHTGLQPSTNYTFTLYATHDGIQSGTTSVTGSTGSPPGPAYPPETAPNYDPFVSYSNLYYVATFDTAPGKYGSTQVGDLYAYSSNYVFCKREYGVTTGMYGHNKYWLYTDLDSWWSGSGRAWVSAYYLSNWGDDEARDNNGTVIPDCPLS